MAASLRVGGRRAERGGPLAPVGPLYLPEAWAGDAERRRAAKVPEDVPFLTKPAIARAMLARALDAGVPCGWVLGDEVYGADRRLRLIPNPGDQFGAASAGIAA